MVFNTTKKWVSQRTASDFLGVSERILLISRKSGVLTEGDCWKKKFPTNPNSDILYQLENCKIKLKIYLEK